MSIFQLSSFAARRTFCPRLPIASEKLAVVYDHLHVLVRHTRDRNPADLGRTQGMSREHHRILRILDDVDLLAPELADDGLDAHSLHPDACANAVDVPIAAEDSDLGSFASFASATFYYDGAIVNLGYFLLEKPNNKLGRRSRNDDTGVLPGLFNTLDHAPDALTDGEVLQPRLFLFWQPSFGLAQIANQVLAFDALYRAVDEVANSLYILGIDSFAFRLADFLKNDLLRSLGRDASQRLGSAREAHAAPDLGFRLGLFGLIHRDFVHRVSYGLHNTLNGVDLNLVGLGVQLGG